MGEEVREKLSSILQEVLGERELEIRGEQFLFSDLALESLSLVELSFALEQTFALRIEEQDLWNLGNYILMQGWFCQGEFSQEARSLIFATHSCLSERQLAELSHPQQLSQYLTVQDILTFICRKQNSALSTCPPS